MGFFDKIKSGIKGAIIHNPIKNHNFNQLNLEAYNRNPSANPSINPNAMEDTDHNNVPDALETRPPKNTKFMGMDFAKKDISRNKKGHYVSTMTYPLPPCKHECGEFEKNRRMRNANNKFI